MLYKEAKKTFVDNYESTDFNASLHNNATRSLRATSHTSNCGTDNCIQVESTPNFVTTPQIHLRTAISAQQFTAPTVGSSWSNGGGGVPIADLVAVSGNNQIIQQNWQNR
jgi:hypothetical protein